MGKMSPIPPSSTIVFFKSFIEILGDLSWVNKVVGGVNFSLARPAWSRRSRRILCQREGLKRVRE